MIFPDTRLKKIYLANLGERGAAMLISTLVIMVLLLIVALTIAALGLGEINMSTNDKESKEAISNAETGVKDAFIKVVRNKDYDTSGLPGGYYQLQLDTGTAKIVVEKDEPSLSQDTVYSTGVSNDKKRKLKAILSIDSMGKVTISSMEEDPTNIN